MMTFEPEISWMRRCSRRTFNTSVLPYGREFGKGSSAGGFSNSGQIRQDDCPLERRWRRSRHRDRRCGETVGGPHSRSTMGPSSATTAPHQHALSTRAGCECIVHAIQALCGLNPGVTSVDGTGAYDSVSWRAMLEGLMQVDGGATLPFVRMFHGAPSEWEDDFRQVHTISQEKVGSKATR